jgi:hypothetical protein
VVHVLVCHKETSTGAEKGGEEEDTQPHQHGARRGRMRHGLRLGADTRFACVAVDPGQAAVGRSDGVTFVVCAAPVAGEAAVAAGEAVGEGGAGICVDAAGLEAKGEKEDGEETDKGEGEAATSSS